MLRPDTPRAFCSKEGRGRSSELQRRGIFIVAKKLKLKLACDPRIRTTLPADFIFCYGDTCLSRFIAALFTTGRKWKQPRCLSTEEEVLTMWYRCAGKQGPWLSDLRLFLVLLYFFLLACACTQPFTCMHCAHTPL